MAGTFFLILGPSGSGKGTVIKHLRKVFPEAVFPVSCTTRSPRPHEREGEVYNFLTKEDFKKRIATGEFLEWAMVHNDNFYGTLKKPITEALAANKMVIREVDIQGVQSIQKIFPREQVVSIFITAPSWENLKHRILKRSVLPAEEINERKISFEKEMAFSNQCDFVVMSEEGKIAEYCGEVEGVIRARMAR